MGAYGEKFRAQYRADEATIAKTNEIGRQHAEKINSGENRAQSSKSSQDADCGRGIGSDNSGRVSSFTNQESGNKTGKASRADAVKAAANKSQTANTGSRSAAVNAGAQSAGARGAVSGQSAGQGAAASSGGQSSGGQGGQSGGGTGGGQSGGQSGGGQGR